MRQYFMGDWFNGAAHVPFSNRDDGLTKVAIYGAGVAGISWWRPFVWGE
jgi:hypothetical protein